MDVMRKLGSIIFCVGFCMGAFAQDPYFSQYTSSPMLINPCFAGYRYGNCDIRLTSNYRNQWATITTPYVTQMVSVDVRIGQDENNDERNWFGLGGYVYNQTAGDGNLQNFKASFLPVYNLGLNKENTTFLSGGINIGFVNRSVDFNKLVFEDQWNGSGFSGSPSTDPLSTESFFYLDMSAGMIFTFKIKDELRCHIGTSMDHINMPKETFYDFGNNRKEQVMNFHAGVFGEVERNLFLNLETWYHSQVGSPEYNEIIFGADLSYALNDDNVSLYSGLWYRWNRVIIPVVGLDVSGWRMLFSYDASVSGLQPAGSFEISLSKTFNCKPCVFCDPYNDVRKYQKKPKRRKR